LAATRAFDSVCRGFLVAVVLAGGCSSPRGERAGAPAARPATPSASSPAAPTAAEPPVSVASAEAPPAPAVHMDAGSEERAPAPPSAPRFDAASAPRTKIALVDALDHQLRTVEPDDTPSVVPDGRPLVDDCRPRAPDADRGWLRQSLLECRALTQWKSSRRLALNFGTRDEPYDDRCPDLRRLEKSELYYAVGNEVFKVTLQAVSFRGGHAATAVRCSKKRGSAGDFERLRVNCPGRPWRRVTQSDGRCP
jgi:hypothetical protein